MADRTFLDWPFFDDTHRRLALELDAWAGTHLAHACGTATDAVCRALVTALGRDGWLRYCVPAAHGGRLDGIDSRSLCILRDTLARHEGLADFAFAMQGLGSGAISIAGSEDLKRRYLPRVAAGEAIAAFALSEPDAGSDVAALATTARLEGSHYVIDGTKTWISNGGIADFYCVFARTGDGSAAEGGRKSAEAGRKSAEAGRKSAEGEGTSAQGGGKSAEGGRQSSRGISAFVVDADSPGLAIAKRIEVIAPHPLATLEFSGCRVPASQRVGEPGSGFKIAMQTLDIFRASVAAAALGFARRALDEAIARATGRRMFGQTLADFQLTQAAIADMATGIDASALLTYRAAWLRDVKGERTTREAAMAKMAATETAQGVIDRAVQIFGGAGVETGNPVERLYREIRALRIYEGATEVQKLIIARETLKG